MAQLAPLSFEEFQKLLAELLQIEIASLKPEAYWINDLGIDSIRIVQVLLRLQELGLPLALERAWEIQTVGDAYRYYQEQIKA
jgi:acyl carrier protein